MVFFLTIFCRRRFPTSRISALHFLCGLLMVRARQSAHPCNLFLRALQREPAFIKRPAKVLLPFAHWIISSIPAYLLAKALHFAERCAYKCHHSQTSQLTCNHTSRRHREEQDKTQQRDLQPFASSTTAMPPDRSLHVKSSARRGPSQTLRLGASITLAILSWQLTRFMRRVIGLARKASIFGHHHQAGTQSARRWNSKQWPPIYQAA